MVRGEAKLFVGQISYEADKASIYRLFQSYGEVLEVQILYDKDTRQSRGAAFVTYGSTEEADTAIAALHDRYRMLSNRFMQVSYAKNSPNISPYGHHMAVDVAHRNPASNPMPGAQPVNTNNSSFPQGPGRGGYPHGGYDGASAVVMESGGGEAMMAMGGGRSYESALHALPPPPMH
eukprot:PhF_6_TR30454/c0_g1_i1/m.44727